MVELPTTRLLFVCMGNICRSPLAEGIFAHVTRERNEHSRYRIDSAGIGDWHQGELADPRSQTVARKHGIELTSRARQVIAPDDFKNFDLLLAMDRQNQRDLISLAPKENQNKIRLMREFDPEGGVDAEVPDPYYGGALGFDRVFAMLHRSCLRLFELLEQGGGRLL
jgi:protein-tyrosine phosphatase